MAQLQDRAARPGSAVDDYQRIAVRKVGGVIGAVVEGVRANGDVGINGDTAVVRKGDASHYCDLPV